VVINTCIIHIYVGYGIKGYNRIKKKKYLDAVLDVLPWYFFFTTACFMVSSYIPSVPEGIYNALTPIGTKLFPYAAAAILLTQGRHKKGILGKLFGGIDSFYDLIILYGRCIVLFKLLLWLCYRVIGTILNQWDHQASHDSGGHLIYTDICRWPWIQFCNKRSWSVCAFSRLQYINFLINF
jgi:V/A-type H+-transporting ATPase subunit I